MRVYMSWYCREREAHEITGVLHLCKLTGLDLPGSGMCTNVSTRTHTSPPRHTSGNMQSWPAQPKCCSITWESHIAIFLCVQGMIVNKCFGASQSLRIAKLWVSAVIVTLEIMLKKSEYFIPMYYFYYLFITCIAIATRSSATVKLTTLLGTAQTGKTDEELTLTLIRWSSF